MAGHATTNNAVPASEGLTEGGVFPTEVGTMQASNRGKANES